jgi:hypothetical protein
VVCAAGHASPVPLFAASIDRTYRFAASSGIVPLDVFSGPPLPEVFVAPAQPTVTRPSRASNNAPIGLSGEFFHMYA